MSQFKPANIHSVVDMRTKTDEHLPYVFATLGYTKSYAMEDTRLAIGCLIAITSGVTFLLDKKMNFEEALPYTKILLVFYGLLSTAAWAYAKFVQGDIIYQGTNKDKKTITVKGKFDKYVPEYNMTIQSGSGAETKATLKFNEIFDRFGNLYDEVLASWFKGYLDEEAKNK